MINMPDKIKIGPYIYSVKETDKLIIVNNRACTGSISYQHLTIDIMTGRGFQKKQQTVVHEILHGIHNYRNFIAPDMSTDNMADEFATGVLSVIKDNHELISWLMQDSPNDKCVTKSLNWKDKIKVGLFDYSVKKQDSIIVGNHEFNSDIDYEQQIIMIDSTQGLQKEQQSILYRVMHAILDYRCFNPEKKDNELIVDEFAHGILMFIKQNHELMAWLSSD